MGLLNYLTGRKDKVKNPYENPAKYRDDLLMTPQNIAGIRNQANQSVNTQLMGTQAAIKQAGAANRMPAGAILSNLAGSQYQAARGAASIEPQLAQQKQQSIMNYLQMQGQYNQGQIQADQANQGNRELVGNTLGSLAKLAILYNSGYFNSEDAQAQQAGGNPDQYSGIGVQLGNFKKLGR